MTAGGTVVEMLEIAALFLGSTVLALVALLAVVRNRAEQSRQPDEPVEGDEPGDEAESGALAEDDSPAGRRARRKARLAALRQRAGDAPGEDGPPGGGSLPAGPASNPGGGDTDGAPLTPAAADTPPPVDPIAAAPEPGGTVVPASAPETPAAPGTPPLPPPDLPEPNPAGGRQTDDAAPSAALSPPDNDAADAPPAPVAAPTAAAGTPYGRAPGASPYAAASSPMPTDPDPAASPTPPPRAATSYTPPSASAGTPYGPRTAATPYGGGPTAGAPARAPGPAPEPSTPAPPPPRRTGRVVLGIDPAQTDEPEGPQRHGVTPAEELTADQIRRLNPRARRAALRKQNQKPLPDLDAIPPDLKEEVIALLGQGKKIKAFGVFRKRLDISFKDAEKGVALVAHEADLDLD